MGNGTSDYTSGSLVL